MDSNLVLIATSVGFISITTVVLLITRGMGSGASTIKPNQKNGTNEKAQTKNESAKPKKSYPGGKLSVYFGSQTGTAEGFARIVMEEAKKQGFDASTVDLEDFAPETLANTELAIFLMATYGEGEPTDNASTFHKWLLNANDETPSNYLAKLKFCVFGLGNRQYEHFNRMGKLTNEHLEKLGGRRMLELGLGDDDGSLEDDFEKWKDTLWPALVPSNTAITTQNSLLDDKEVESNFRIIKFKRSNPANKNISIHSLSKPLFQCHPATLSSIRELRSDVKNGSTYHVELCLEEANMSYKTADNLAIMPENSTSEVEMFAMAQGYNLDDVFDIQPIEGNEDAFRRMIPTPFSVRELLTLYLDLKGLVRPAVVSKLIYYVSDPAQKSWLKDLLAKDKRDQYKSVVEDSRQNIFSLLMGPLSSCKLPLDALLSIVPVQQPRYYTISSSSSLYPSKPHITVSLTDEILKNGQLFVGQCSGFLKRMNENTSADEVVTKKLRVLVKESAFRLPASLSTPVILVGPGTGFAPMRALLQERKFVRDRDAVHNSYGSTTLYFGCKTRDQDHIYREEMEAYVADGIITNYHIAYSRESKEKVYVQHMMQREENVKAIWADLQNGAYVYVCGATAMGHDVSLALKTIAMDQGKTKEEADKYLSGLKDTGRYVQELWN